MEVYLKKKIAIVPKTVIRQPESGTNYGARCLSFHQLKVYKKRCENVALPQSTQAWLPQLTRAAQKSVQGPNVIGTSRVPINGNNMMGYYL